MAMMWGLDTLALGRYGKVALAEWPQGFGGGCFAQAELFKADPMPWVRRILDKGVAPFWRVQGWWKDGHNYSRADFPAIIKEAKRWKPVIAAYPQLKWYYSGACEHLLNPGDSSELARQVLDTLPGITYVNTGKSRLLGVGIINEVHGSKAIPPYGPHAMSWDGSASEDGDITTMKSTMVKAEYQMLWTPAFNLRYETNDTTPRPDRKYQPEARHFRNMAFLTTNRGDVSLPPKWLYKSNSERKPIGDDRADKPLMICPLDAPGIALKTAQGVVIASATRYPTPYADGRNRFYFTSMWGFQMARKALEKTGDARLEVWANGKKWGVVNPAFRLGGFQQ